MLDKKGREAAFAKTHNLSGKALQEGLERMRREANRQRVANKRESSVSTSAVDLAASKRSERRQPKTRPKSYGGSLKYDIGKIGKGIGNFLPNPGFAKKIDLKAMENKLPKTQGRENREEGLKLAAKRALAARRNSRGGRSKNNE